MIRKTSKTSFFFCESSEKQMLFTSRVKRHFDTKCLVDFCESFYPLYLKLRPNSEWNYLRNFFFYFLPMLCKLQNFCKRMEYLDINFYKT